MGEKAAKAKRSPAAQVTAEHISRMASPLPAMAAQLIELQQNQVALQQQLDVRQACLSPGPARCRYL